MIGHGLGFRVQNDANSAATSFGRIARLTCWKAGQCPAVVPRHSPRRAAARGSAAGVIARTGSSSSWLAAAKHLLEALAREPQALGGACLGAAFAQGVLDHASLELLDRRPQRHWTIELLSAGADPLGEMLRADGSSIFGQRHRALDLVFELPNVPRERVAS